MQYTQPEGFLSKPTLGNQRAVLVLHPWWGLNDTIKNFCTRLAEAGFLAFAPDLYHGKIASTIPEAENLVKTINDNQAMADITAAVDYLSEQNGRPVAVIGFSLGAYYAIQLSTIRSAACQFRCGLLWRRRRGLLQIKSLLPWSLRRK